MTSATDLMHSISGDPLQRSLRGSEANEAIPKKRLLRPFGARNDACRPTRAGAGFTFIELMIVIVIIAVFAAISAPLFKNTFSGLELEHSLRQLQTFIGFLHQRSVIEKKVIFLDVDNHKKQYWAEIQDAPTRLKTYSFPENLSLKVKKITNPQEESILFYPDGAIDAVTIEISAPDGKTLTITTEGVYGGAKIKEA